MKIELIKKRIAMMLVVIMTGSLLQMPVMAAEFAGEFRNEEVALFEEEAVPVEEAASEETEESAASEEVSEEKGFFEEIFDAVGDFFAQVKEEFVTTSDNSASKDSASKDSASKDSASKDSASKDSASKNSTSGDSASKNSTSGDSASKNSTSGDSASKNSTSSDSASKNSTSSDSASKNSTSSDSASKNSASNNTTPSQNGPGDVPSGGGTTSGDIVPGPTPSDNTAPSENDVKWKAARDAGFGSIYDTVKLTANGKKFELDAASISGNEARVTIVKGNKFVIKNATDFAPSPKNKLVAVSKKGVIKGKKRTATSIKEVDEVYNFEYEPVPVKFKAGGKDITLYVNVVEPVFTSLKVCSSDAKVSGNNASDAWKAVKRENWSKKNGPSFVKPVVVVVGLGQRFDAVLDIPTNVDFSSNAVKDKGGYVGEYQVQFKDDNMLHVTGIAQKKGSTKHIMLVNGKKYTVKVKVKD